MADDLRRRAEEIFQQAADLPPPARSAWLQDVCGGDAALRAAVESLLACLNDTRETPLDRPPPLVTWSDAASLGVMPQRFGNYRIIRLIDQGGMGAVYEAEQDNPRRRVAVKFMRPGMAGEDMLRRFNREAQLLGQLQHPGIAQIYEAGVEETPLGRQPYFAMEFIPGEPLTEYAETHRLSTHERLAMFANVCDAVHHAHQKGVIHRDLKPANILVVEPESSIRSTADTSKRGADDASRTSALDHTGQKPAPRDSALSTQHSAPWAQPKVLDFGVARMTDADMHTVTMRTDVGQLVGTVPYMSPEQVMGDSGLLDPRSDVYALGVLLYELLSGRLPFDVRNRPIPEAARIIREEEPSRLSSINPLFRGDIETIVLKALEKDKARRYQSAAELAADIRRYLRDEPIVARPASALYNARKFARRNPGLVGGLAAAFVALAAGLVGVSWFWIRESAQRQRADRTAEESRRLAYRASLAAAQAAIQNDDVGLARRSLAAAPDELRGWEWSHLNWLCNRSRMTLPGHEGGATAAAFLNDESRIATGAGDGTIRIVDAVAGTELSKLRDVQAPVLHLASSSDARFLLAIYGATETVPGSSAVLWDLRDKRPLWRRTDRPVMTRRPFTFDAGLVAIKPQNAAEIDLLDPATGQRVASTPLPGPLWQLVDCSPTQPHALIGRDEDAKLIEIPSGKVLWSATAYEPRFTTDGHTVLGRSGLEMTLFDAATGVERRRVSLPMFPAACWDVGPDASLLAACERSGIVQLFSTQDGAPLWTFHGHEAPGAFCGFSPDGGRLATAAADGTVRIWEPCMGAAPLFITSAESQIGGTLSADGRYAVTLGWGTVRLWDTETAAEIWSRFLTHNDGAPVVAIGNDAGLVAVGGWEQLIHLLDLRTGEVTATVGPLSDKVVSLAFTAAGLRAVTTSDWTSIAVLDGQTGKGLHRVESFASPACTCAVAPDGAMLAVGHTDGSVTLWSCVSGRPVRTLRDTSAEIVHTAFSRDGARLLAATADNRLLAWDTTTLGDALVLAGAKARILGAGLHPDGTRIAASCADGAIHLWDASGAELMALTRTRQASAAVTFSVDGRRLLSMGGAFALAAFESGEPECGFPRREQARRAREIIDALFPTYHFASAVIERLEGDSTLSDAERRAAIAMARARGDNFNWLNSSAWGLVRHQGKPPEEYQRGLKIILEVCRQWPDEHAFVNTLAVALYRNGRYAEALAALDRCDERHRAVHGEIHPMDLALRAMARHQLGQRRQAHEDLQLARERLAASPYADDNETHGFLREAEVLVMDRRSASQ